MKIYTAEDSAGNILARVEVATGASDELHGWAREFTQDVASRMGAHCGCLNPGPAPEPDAFPDAILAMKEGTISTDIEDLVDSIVEEFDRAEVALRALDARLRRLEGRG